MILRSPVVAGNDAVEPFKNFTGHYDQPGFFQSFTLGGGAKRLSQFHNASRQRPFSQQGWITTLHQQSAALVDNDCSNADDGTIWVFTVGSFRHVWVG